MRRLVRHAAWCAVVALGCHPVEPAPAPPPFSGQPVDQVPRGTVLDYGRAQKYVAISGDSQRLMIGTFPQATYGPRAHIDPVAGGFRQDSTSLRAGRLLARVVNDDSIAYPKLNLGPRDTVYWWVQETRGQLRSILISTRADAQTLVKGFRVESHPENGKDFKWRQAEARFVWSDRDEELWVACQIWECCRTDEIL